MMKKKVLSLMIVIAALTIVISGCADNRVDLVDTGVLSLEKQAAGKVYIAYSDAYKNGAGFVVTGVLKRHGTIGMPIKAHVDVTVLSPDGKVLDEARSQDVYVPRHTTGRGQSLKRFSVSFSNIPPTGSSVQLISHSGLHDDKT